MCVCLCFTVGQHYTLPLDHIISYETISDKPVPQEVRRKEEKLELLYVQPQSLFELDVIKASNVSFCLSD